MQIENFITWRKKVANATYYRMLPFAQSEDYLENPQKQAKVKEYQRQIDELVYNLYGLTEEEIKIVEEFYKR